MLMFVKTVKLIGVMIIFSPLLIQRINLYFFTEEILRHWNLKTGSPFLNLQLSCKRHQMPHALHWQPGSFPGRSQSQLGQEQAAHQPLFTSVLGSLLKFEIPSEFMGTLATELNLEEHLPWHKARGGAGCWGWSPYMLSIPLPLCAPALRQQSPCGL